MNTKIKNIVVPLIVAFLSIGTVVSSQVILFPNRGGTGTSSIPNLNDVLVGQSNGTYAPQATSTLGYWTSASSTDKGLVFSTSTGVLNEKFPYAIVGNWDPFSGADYQPALSLNSKLNGFLAGIIFQKTSIDFSHTNVNNLLYNTPGNPVGSHVFYNAGYGNGPALSIGATSVDVDRLFTLFDFAGSGLTEISMSNIDGSASFANGQAVIDGSGNITKIRNVTTSWPSSQGAANTLLKNDGSGNFSWVATSSLGLGLSGGSNGFLARWTDASTLSTGLFRDNATVAGINATSSLYTFNLQGTGGIAPLNVASSSGTSLFTILGNGNVGFGSTSPVAFLELASTTGGILDGIRIQNSTTTGTSTGSRILFSSKRGTVNTDLASVGGILTNNSATQYTGDMVFSTATSSGLAEVGRFTSGGRLGIGSTTPDGMFSIKANANTNAFTVSSSTGNQVFIIDTAGRVGVGSTTPGARLSILGLDGSTAAAPNAFDGKGGTGVSSGQGGGFSFLGGTGGASGGIGGDIRLTAGLGGSTSGGAVVINGGTGNGSGGGGAVSVTGGNGGSTTGGALNLKGGTGGGSGAGGDTLIQGGDSGSASGGATNVRSGSGASSGSGGNILIQPGNGGGSAGSNGSISITGGTTGSSGSTPGGTIAILGGTGAQGGAAAGGAITITGGTGGTGGGSAGAKGANITITGGTSGTGSTPGRGGDVFIYGGAPASGSVFGDLYLGMTSGGTGQGRIGAGTSTLSSLSAFYTIQAWASTTMAFNIATTTANSLFNVNRDGTVGINTNVPTAYLHLPASDTGKASLTITAGTAPTTPNNGDIWHDSAQKTITHFVAGVKQPAVGAIFTATANKVIANTNTDTSAIPSGVGTTTLPANFFTAGKTVHIHGGGLYELPITGGSATVKIYYGSTTLATITTTGLLSNAPKQRWVFDAYVTCRTTGASGTVITDGSIGYSSNAATNIYVNDPLNNSGDATTIDTTVAKLLDVTVAFDTAAASKIATTSVATYEIQN